MPADKSRNLYELDKNRYEKILRENVTKNYRLAPAEAHAEINTEAQRIATRLDVADRMDTLAPKDAFITLKDHKDNFENSLPCRLINPAKSEVGLVSKRLLDRINVDLRNKLAVQQWKNSADVTAWFAAIEDKGRCVFTCFDVCEFYPSISEELLLKAVRFARKSTTISDEEIETICHARNSLLFSGGRSWTKNSREGCFDVTMGSYDGAEICELVGTYILATLPLSYKRKSVGLYRDDGLMVHRNISGRTADRIKKDLTQHFASFGLRITIHANLKSTNFLDLTLDLNCGKHYLYRKPNDNPCYIHKGSNHPPSILAGIPGAISRRITDVSSDKEAFETAAPLYDSALKASGYQEKIAFIAERKEASAKRTGKRKNRGRRIIWFNPPYSKNVRTRIGKKFLRLVSKHFPKSAALSKIFDRNTLKVSFSCMPNVATIIKGHNHRILHPEPLAGSCNTQSDPPRSCNCRKPDECPLGGECLVSSIVYKASVEAQGSTGAKHYIGLTEGTFKKRYANHLTSFRHEKYMNSTELSKYVLSLKEKNIPHTIKWSILRKARAYSPGSRRCQLCLTEKLCIATAENDTLLNKRTELVSTCRHRRKFLLSQFCPDTKD